MSLENLGSVNTGSMPEDETWILFALNLAKTYVKFACGEPPFGCEIEIQWHDHDLGSYPSLGLSSNTYIPEKYIAGAENALWIFNKAICWSSLKEHYESQHDTEDD